MTEADASRARSPDVVGTVERDGVRLAYEVVGDGSDRGVTLLMLPAWSIVHSRFWKAQVPYLSRHYRVVTFDGRGNGRSDRPEGAARYGDREYCEDAVAVMDATGTERAVLVALSSGGTWGVHVAARYPERVLGFFAMCPSCDFDVPRGERDADDPWDRWNAQVEDPKGWAKYNRNYWLNGGYDDFLSFFFRQMFVEKHSTKQIEDCVGWGRETSPATLADTAEGESLDRAGPPDATLEELCAQVRCPVAVVHGTDDRICPPQMGIRLAELTGGSLTLLDGVGHGPMSRHPVKMNLLIRDFVDRLTGPQPRPLSPAVSHEGDPHSNLSSEGDPHGGSVWVAAARRRRRVLYLSSPIGLGHARRDLAIAQELRALDPDVEVSWLAQHPVTTVLEAAGEQIHPASRWLANESGHIEHEAGEHDLNAFQAIRRMDEILVSNFMVFQEVVEQEQFDLVVGDESWEVDYFLHENPELKRFAFAWITDFVGWLPMPDGGDREAALTADYNAEMIEQRARFARVRDRSVFVGNPEDVVPEPFGPGLPLISDWVRDNFGFAGYVTGFDPAAFADLAALREELGRRPDERQCVVTVGGSGVGEPLLRRVLDAAPLVRRQLPDLSFLVVAGPRIDPARLPRRRGVSVRGHLPGLHRHLAAADVAVVQGGLATTMELTACQRPFVYVPLRNHFEQNLHVRYRLDRYGAGRCLPYEEATDPDALAEAIVKEVDREVSYRPVETDGAAVAARMLADLL